MPEAYSVNGSELKAAAARVRNQLRQLASMGDKKPSSEQFEPMLRNLARHGQTLFLQLMPADPGTEASEIQQLLEAESRQPKSSDLKVKLAAPDLFVPWGFLFPGVLKDVPQQPKVSLTDMKGFALAHFRISVVYNGDQAFAAGTQNSVLPDSWP